MKQTAVEWLLQQIYSDEYQRAFGRTYISIAITEQAKAMEKEQMNNAYNDDRPNLTIYESNEAFEQYYNETFKSE